VASHQLAEGHRILIGHDSRDKLMVITVSQRLCSAYSSLPVNQYKIRYATPIANGNAAPAKMP